MQLKRCPRGIGFDASTYIAPVTAQRFLEAGYQWVARYLNRRVSVRETPDTDWPVSLSRQELGELTQAGLAVVLVQFAGGCSSGDARGAAAAANAAALGVPQGCHLYCDAEGWSGVDWPHVSEYLTQWQAAVRLAGYRPALYVGPGVDWGADPARNLRKLPGYSSYWRAASVVPAVADRGYALVQGTQCTVYGQTIDADICALDHLGDRPYAVAA